MGIVVGVDLGTTKSVVASCVAGVTVVVPNARGNRSTPSVVCFPPGGAVVVGESAAHLGLRYPERTFWSFKHLLGAIDQRQIIDSHHLLPESLATYVVRELIESAVAFFDDEVTGAIITVPAGAGMRQRQATRRAVEAAGTRVLRMIAEPTAAALATPAATSDRDRQVLVVDLGGGTCDIAALELSDGVYEIKSTTSDMRLGGDDFDLAIADAISERVVHRWNLDVRKDVVGFTRLLAAVELAKRDLSAANTSVVSVPSLAFLDGQPLHLSEPLSRSEFNELTTHLVDRCVELADTARERASGWDPFLERHVEFVPEEIVLAGGGTRSVALRSALIDRFGCDVTGGINPDEIVACGAALQAGVLQGDIKDMLLLDALAPDYGIVENGTFRQVIPHDTTIPTTRHVYSVEPSRGVILVAERSTADSDPSPVAVLDLGDVPLCDMVFDVDANGILHVAAQVNDRDLDSVTVRDESCRDADRFLADQILAQAEQNPAATPFVFVSYSRPDQNYVSRLAAHLEAAGIPSWYDTRVEAGASWLSELERQIATCSAMIVVISPHARRSEFMENEYLMAKELRKPIFPVRIADVRLFALLNLQHTDLFDQTMPDASFVRTLRSSLTSSHDEAPGPTPTPS